MILSSLTLLAAIWVEKNASKYTWFKIVWLCAVGFAGGIAGRVYAPTSSFFVGLTKRFKKTKKDKKAEVKQSHGDVQNLVNSVDVGTTGVRMETLPVKKGKPMTTKRGVSPGAIARGA